VPDKNGVNMLLIAHPKVGKTTFLASAQDSPYGRNVLVLDCAGDAGVRSISHRSDVDVLRIMRWEQMQKAYDWLLTGTHEYRTIGIDPLSSLQYLARRDEIMPASKTPLAPSYDDWNKLNWLTLTVVRDFKNLASERGWNVIITDWVKEEKDETLGRIVARPQCTPGVASQIGGSVDIVGHMYINTTGDREIDFAPKFMGVSGKREPGDQQLIPDKMVNPTMVELLELVQPIQHAAKKGK